LTERRRRRRILRRRRIAMLSLALKPDELSKDEEASGRSKSVPES